MRKTFLFAALMAVATLVGCSDDPQGGGEDPIPSTISVNPTLLEFTCEAGSKEVAVTSDTEWIVVGPESIDWVNVSVESGEGNATVEISVEENTEDAVRSTNVIFYNVDGVQVSLDVMQDEAQADEPSTGLDDLEGPFSVEYIGSGATSVYVNVDPEDYSGAWYVAAVSRESYDANYSTPLDLAMAFIDMELNDYYTDLSIIDDVYVFKGAEENVDLLAGWGSTSNTEYVFALFGIDNFGNIQTEITSFSAFTGDPELTDFTIECELTNITSTTVDVAIRPSDITVYYVFSFLEGTELDDLLSQSNGQKTLFDFIMDVNTSSDGTIGVTRGDMITDSNGNPYTAKDFSPATEYAFVAYGLTIEGNYITGRCCDAQIARFTTTSANSAPERSWSSVEPCFTVANVEIPQSAAPVAKKISRKFALR